MKAHKLARRTDGIIRWLERMKKAYISGHVESAYIDAECAVADLEDLKSCVFADVVNERKTFFSWPCMRVVFLAVIIVMLTVMPVSHELNIKTEIKTENITVSSLKPDILPEINTPVTPKVSQRKQENVSVSSKAVQPKTRKSSKPKPQTVVTKPSPSRTIAYDKIPELLQTGQRAMKNHSRVIKLKGDYIE